MTRMAPAVARLPALRRATASFNRQTPRKGAGQLCHESSHEPFIFPPVATGFFGDIAVNDFVFGDAESDAGANSA